MSPTLHEAQKTLHQKNQKCLQTLPKTFVRAEVSLQKWRIFFKSKEVNSKAELCVDMAELCVDMAELCVDMAELCVDMAELCVDIAHINTQNRCSQGIICRPKWRS